MKIYKRLVFPLLAVLLWGTGFAVSLQNEVSIVSDDSIKKEVTLSPRLKDDCIIDTLNNDLTASWTFEKRVTLQKKTPPYKPDAGFIECEWYDTPPDIISFVRPVYPLTAKFNKVEGTVELDVTILKDGTVDEIKIRKSLLPGPNGLDEAAIQAVKQWSFSPRTYYGHQIDTVQTIPMFIEFSLDSDIDDAFKLKLKLTPQDAQIELLAGTETVYAKAGAKTIRGYVSGDYTLRVSKPGYEPYEELLYLETGNTYKKQIQLQSLMMIPGKAER